jgi:cysteine synthase A
LKAASDITHLIGRTPLVRLNKVTEGCCAKIFAKLESFNPANSVKDRISISMIESAEKNSDISPEKTTIIEPTSGNTGIGLAMVAAVKGYKLIIVMPDTMSIERRVVMLAYGAKIILTPGYKGMNGAIEKAKQLKKEIPHSFIPQQFQNMANPRIHKETTGPEIWEDTNGDIDILVAGVGTGGTITGIAQYIRELKPTVQYIAVEPADSPILSGGEAGPHKIQGIGAGFIPEILDRSVINEVIQVTNDQAITMARKLAREEGILAGISSGAAVHAAIKTGERLVNKDKTIIVIIPSHGERYLSTVLFEELVQEAKELVTTEV